MPPQGFKNQTWQPIRVEIRNIKKFKQSNKDVIIVNNYPEMLEELFLLRHPRFRFDKNYQTEFAVFRRKHFAGRPEEKAGAWFYFPWLKQLVYFLPEAMHQELRTGRNRNLITAKEQGMFYKSTIGILGLSVGSHAALTIVMTGGAKYLKLADPDSISGSNLNRIRTGFQEIGINKVISVARKIYEINPYSEVEIFSSGLQKNNLSAFLKRKRKIDLLIEEMDNPFLKLSVRFDARRLGIPVIMAADNGDGIIVDIERYDLQKNYPILHGLMGNIKPKEVENLKKLDPRELPRLIAKIAGAPLATLRMLESVAEVGKSLYSWPQLGTAATLCGSVLANLGRRILLKQKNIISGRYEVNIDTIFESDYNNKEIKKKRLKTKRFFLKKLGIKI